VYTVFVPKNITIGISDEAPLWARRKAAEENTSVSRLVGEMLEYWRAFGLLAGPGLGQNARSPAILRAMAFPTDIDHRGWCNRRSRIAVAMMGSPKTEPQSPQR
jgi:hypothetical protein